MHGDDIVRETRQRDGEIPLDLGALGVGELRHAGERRGDRSSARRGREVEVEHLEDGMGSETEPDTVPRSFCALAHGRRERADAALG